MVLNASFDCPWSSSSKISVVAIWIQIDIHTIIMVIDTMSKILKMLDAEYR